MLDTKIYINDIKKEVKKYHNETISKNQYILIIYINRSEIEGNIEAATYCSTLQQMKHQYLRKDIIHNVYIAELKGIAMTLEIAKESDIIYITCEINTDSQAAIKVVIKLRQQSRQ